IRARRRGLRETLRHGVRRRCYRNLSWGRRITVASQTRSTVLLQRRWQQEVSAASRLGQHLYLQRRQWALATELFGHRWKLRRRRPLDSLLSVEPQKRGESGGRHSADQDRRDDPR